MTGFEVDPDGAVNVRLDDVAINVEPAPDYEAWHLVGPGPQKQRIICMPGGELAIWS